MRSRLGQGDKTARPAHPRGSWVARGRAALESLREWHPSNRVVIGACVLAAAGLLAGLLAWSFASPYGTTPDEDYHMISAWCPHPGQGGCQIVGETQDGQPIIAAPGKFGSRSCFVDKPMSSVACKEEVKGGIVETPRVNTGTYAGYYYNIMHVFASEDVDRLTVSVRVTNSLIAALLALSVLLFMNAAARRIYVWTVAITAVAGMAWLVGSAAPDSWSIVGVTTVWASITGVFLATVRWRRNGLLATAVIGALLASSARADAGVYVMIAAAAPCIINWRALRDSHALRRMWYLPATVVAIFVIGAVGFVSARQASGMITGGCGVWCAPTPNPQGALHLFVSNVVYFFDWITNSWRGTWDVGQPQFPALILFAAGALVVGAALSRGGMTKAKALALALAAGVFIGAPILSLQLGHSLLALGQGGLQQRYVFPALIILVGVALTPTANGVRRYLSPRFTVALWAVVVIAQAVFLHQWIRRCVTGLAIQGFNLTPGAQWWWASGPGPMAVWVIGTLGFAVASAAVVFVWWQPRSEDAIDELTPASAEPATEAEPGARRDRAEEITGLSPGEPDLSRPGPSLPVGVAESSAG